MLKWHRDYLVGTDVKRPEHIRKKINQRKFVPDIYLLTMPSNPDNLLDIVPAVVLIQKASYDLCPEIIGMAKGKDGAIELFQELIEKVYKKNGNFNLTEYLENR